MKEKIKLKKLIKLRLPANCDKTIHFSVVILMLLGTLMVCSCSVGDTITSNLAVIKTMFKQIIFMSVAYIIMVNVANYFSLHKLIPYIKYFGWVICFLLLICLFFKGSGGAKSWIYIPLPVVGQISIQPSEFMKVFMIVCMACFIEKTKRLKNATWLDITGGPLGFYGIAFALIFLQNDLGSLVVLTFICAICLLIPSNPTLKKFQMISFGGVMFVLILICVLMTDWGINFVEHIPLFGSHVAARFEMAINPWTDEYFRGFQLINSLYAFASGGWKGLGLGQSIQKMQYLPAASTDYILAITVEELGLFGFGTILIGYGLIIFKLFKHALESKHQSYKVIYIGTALFLFIHFVLNVGGVIGFIPLTGIPLLFISAGASSLVSVCLAIGICQALISKEKKLA